MTTQTEAMTAQYLTAGGATVDITVRISHDYVAEESGLDWIDINHQAACTGCGAAAQAYSDYGTDDTEQARREATDLTSPRAETSSSGPSPTPRPAGRCPGPRSRSGRDQHRRHPASAQLAQLLRLRNPVRPRRQAAGRPRPTLALGLLPVLLGEDALSADDEGPDHHGPGLFAFQNAPARLQSCPPSASATRWAPIRARAPGPQRQGAE